MREPYPRGLKLQKVYIHGRPPFEREPYPRGLKHAGEPAYKNTYADPARTLSTGIETHLLLEAREVNPDVRTLSTGIETKRAGLNAERPLTVMREPYPRGLKPIYPNIYQKISGHEPYPRGLKQKNPPLLVVGS